MRRHDLEAGGVEQLAQVGGRHAGRKGAGHLDAGVANGGNLFQHLCGRLLHIAQGVELYGNRGLLAAGG